MELCISCGRVSGSKICKHCQLTKNIKFMEYTCPECGTKMEIWYKEVTSYKGASWDCFPTMTVELIYHCPNCGCDWDSTYTSNWGDEGQTRPARHYWG